jgi:hypothetical protein
VENLMTVWVFALCIEKDLKRARTWMPCLKVQLRLAKRVDAINHTKLMVCVTSTINEKKQAGVLVSLKGIDTKFGLNAK